MKTKDLIKALSDADPSGELECCVGNVDVYHVRKLPAYYDGAFEVLVHNESVRGKQWSVIGGKIVRSGYKVQIECISLDDAMFDMRGNFPIEIVGEDPDGHIGKMIDRWRNDNAKILARMEEEA